LGRDDQTLDVKVNIWNLTHGGGAARPAGEYRVQITGRFSFEEEAGCTTLILGWWDEARVFAAFDPQCHQGDLGSSPSIQIREDALRKAYENGLGTCRKANNELALALRPDLLACYIQDQTQFHAFGRSRHDLEMLDAVAVSPATVGDDSLTTVTAPRRRIVAEVRRVLRERGFRDRVLAAYLSRCAVCGLQLGLIEAAHILPAAFEGSSEETWNGMAFCANHHKAYDQALITVDRDYHVLVSTTKLEILRQLDLHGGVEEFRRGLRSLIVLPADPACRPRRQLLELGSRIRGWVA
jgi:putative restriction endonuclease